MPFSGWFLIGKHRSEAEGRSLLLRGILQYTISTNLLQPFRQHRIRGEGTVVVSRQADWHLLSRLHVSPSVCPPTSSSLVSRLFYQPLLSSKSCTIKYVRTKEAIRFIRSLLQGFLLSCSFSICFQIYFYTLILTMKSCTLIEILHRN